MDSIRENEVDTRIAYRVGIPKLPMLPVQTEEIFSFPGTNLDERGGEYLIIYNALAKYGIPLRRLYLARRTNSKREAEDEGSAPYTLVLSSEYDPGCETRWKQAVIEIRQGLNDKGIKHQIELIDHRVCMQHLPVSPILATDRGLIDGWNKIRSSVLEIIQDRQWKAIDVLYREYPSYGMLPTIIISARDANEDAWWTSIIPAIEQLLERHGIGFRVAVLYLNEINFTTTNSTAPENSIKHDGNHSKRGLTDEGDLDCEVGAHYTIRRDFYSNVLPMGTSCSTTGSTSTGTLGGPVILQAGNTVVELGITNYHVLIEAIQNQGQTAGPFPPRPDNYGTVVTPSDEDHQAMIQDMHKESRAAATRYKEQREKLNCLTTSDPSWKKTDRLTKETSDQRKALRQPRKKMAAFSRQIGRVYAASGFLTREFQNAGGNGTEPWAVDWCLVGISPSKTISRRLQDVPSAAHSIQDGDEVTGYGLMASDRNYQVMKRGRTSGWTSGVVSSIPSTLNLVTPIVDPIVGVPTIERPVFNNKWGKQPVCVHGIVGTKKVPQFLDSGDSGSLVLLDQGSTSDGVNIVGLGFAGNDASNASYMMPMDLVVQHIEQVTGGMVIEPRNMGNV